jgi:hypothetical protein
MSFKPKKPKIKPYVHKKKDDIIYDDEVTAVIDYDLICFKAASAGEKRFIIVTHKPSGSKKQFKTRTEFYGHYAKKSGGWLAKTNKEREEKGKEIFPLEDFDIVDDRKVDDISFIYNSVNKMTARILDACKTSTYKAYLGSGDNFRHKVATVEKYKEGRQDLIKPLYLEETRQYVKDKFNAIEIKENEDLTNLEADDYLVIEAHKGYQDYLKTKRCTTVQVSTDKDSAQGEGLFYNYDKMKKPFLVKDYGRVFMYQPSLDSKEEVKGYGMCWLLWQMSAGDSADTYKPSKLSKMNVGDIVAYKNLKDTKNLKEGLEATVSLYKKMYPEPVTYNHCITGEEITKDWLELANEYFTLAYMKRSESDQTTFTWLLEEYKIEYK